MAKISAFSWPDTVSDTGLPKKSLEKSVLPSSVRGSASGSSVLTRNISPAPSQSEPVISGVCTYRYPLSWKKRWIAWAATLRTRKAHWNRFARGRRCWMVRRYSSVWRFFWSG